MKALILAAGYATRLYPLTKDNPKPLLKIAGRPIINYIIDKLGAIKEIDEIIVVSNDRFFSNFKSWLKGLRTDKKISIINDRTKSEKARIGAIGDIAFVVGKKTIKNDLLVIGGDNLFTGCLNDFVSFSIAKKSAFTLGLFDTHDKKQASNYGVVHIDKTKRVIDFQEKPILAKSSLVAMCLYYFPADKLCWLKQYMGIGRRLKRRDATGSYIQWLLSKEPVYGFVFQGCWYDIGQIDSYRMADGLFTRHLRKRENVVSA